MALNAQTDLYSVVGVSPTSQLSEISKAYLSKVRIIHPDRFDPGSQKDDWRKANEMLAELNGAYAVLRDPAARAEYDRIRAGSQGFATRPTATQSPAPSSHAIHVPMKSGRSSYSELPTATQNILLQRQTGAISDQFRLHGSGIGRHIAIAAFPLVAGTMYLAANVEGAKWASDIFFLYGIAAIGIAAFSAYNIATALHRARCTLKPNFYITPLYFIKTGFDEVVYWPLTDLSSTNVVHNYRSGLYQNTGIFLTLAGNEQRLSLRSVSESEQLLAYLDSRRRRLIDAAKAGNWHFFTTHDDFMGRELSQNHEPVHSSNLETVSLYLLAVVACLAIVAVTGEINDSRSSRSWRHPDLPVVVNEPSEEGETEPERKNPVDLRALGLVPVEEYKASEPVKQGPERTVDLELTPSAELEVPQVVEFNERQLQLPKTGTLKLHLNKERIAPLEVKADSANYFVKLVDTQSGAAVMTFFVRGGESATLDVPLGSYEMRYASGEHWYGSKFLFGPETGYSKADTTFRFERNNDQVSGYTVTLYRVPNGNLSTSEIDPSQF